MKEEEIQNRIREFRDGYKVGQLSEQERSIKLCDKCKPYQEGIKHERERCLKEFLSLIEEEIKEENNYIEKKMTGVTRNWSIIAELEYIKLRILRGDLNGKLTQKIKEVGK